MSESQHSPPTPGQETCHRQTATSPPLPCAEDSGAWAEARLGLWAARQGPGGGTFSFPLANRVTKGSFTEPLRGQDGTTDTTLVRHTVGRGVWEGRERGLCRFSPSSFLSPASPTF